METTQTFTDPNAGPYDGADRILHVPFLAGTVFRRRGGKFVDLHHQYQAATANSSNLAGIAETEEVGTANGRPESIVDGDQIPVNFVKEKTAVIPTTGRVATEADRGKDFDVYVDADNIQYINLNASVHGVLRVSRIVSADGLHVSAYIPGDLRYGDI